MTSDEIGCVITCIKECSAQSTPELVYAVARLIQPEVTLEEVIAAMRYFAVTAE